MAIAGGDGSIILTTKVDETGLNKGMSTMKSKVKSLTGVFGSLGGVIATAFSVTAILNFSKQAGEFATQTEASVQRLIDIYGSASKSVGNFIDQNAHALGMSRAAAAEFSAVYGNLFSVWADQETNAKLTNHYLNATAVVASKTGRTMEDVQERIRSGLLGNTEAVEDLGIFVNVKTIEMTEAFKRIADGRSWAQLNAYEQSQVRTLAILEQATNKYGSTVANTTALTRSQYQAAFEDFKNTWGQVVNKILIPVLRVLTKIFYIFTAGLKALAGLTGKTIETTDGISSSIDGAIESEEGLTDAIKDTIKAQEASLAGFDKINKLTEETSDASSDGLSSGDTGIGSIEIPEMEFDDSFIDKIDKDLAIIMGAAGLGMVAIGLILLFHGNIAWGVGFIIAGAATVGAVIGAVKDTDMASEVIGVLAQIMGAVGGAMVAIGVALLIFGGSKAVGIGLIVAGATALIGSVAALVAFDVATIENVLMTITAIASGAMLAIGVMLCIFSGPTPVSIGLIAAGAIGLASVVALNFDSIREKIIEIFGAIKEWVSNYGLLVLGAVLCFSGVGIGLGIPMMAKGAKDLAEEKPEEWEKLKETIIEAFGIIQEWIKTYGALVLGVVLCFSGINIGLGIVLMAKGAKEFSEEKPREWETIKNKLENVFGDIMSWIKTYGLLILGIVLCFSGIGVGVGIPLIKKGASELAEEKPREWETIKNKVEEVFGDITKWLKTYGLLILGIVLCFSGVGVGLGIPLIKKGASEFAEAKPREWETIKNKVEDVFGKIGRWVNKYGLLVLGIVLFFSGVGVGLGIALIYKGAKSLVESKDRSWNFLYDKVKEVWGKIKSYWDENIAKYFTSTWWSNLAKNIGNGFIGNIESMINSCISGFEKMVNQLVTSLNKIKYTVPDWVPLIGGTTVGFDLSPVTLKRASLPRLAQGAVIPGGREFLAVLGDQPKGQTNIETPLKTMIEAFNIALNQRGDIGGDNQPIVVLLDGEVVYRNVIKRNKNYTMATGVNPLGA